MITPSSAQLQNQLILADPSLKEPTFWRTVVHITDHSDENGAHGYILNHPTEHTVGALFEDAEFNALKKVPVFHGGPVSEDQLSFVSYWADPNGKLAFKTQISTQEASRFTKKSGTILMAFLGHSGWSKGQLETELKEHAWIPTNTTSKVLSTTQGIEMWKTLLSDLSPYHHLLSLSPNNVTLN